MRTTRRRRLALTPLLTAYAQGGIVALERLIALPLFGRRVDAVVRARAAWLNSQFLDHSGDREFLDAAQRFYEAVVPAPLFIEAMTRHQWRVRRGVEHLFESADALPIRMQRCLNEGIFAVPGLGPAFWSAIAQAIDPLRLPAWTAAIVRGARRVGLVERRTIWYGDLICACERLRQRDPRLTAAP